jgi:hypothetical protein
MKKWIPALVGILVGICFGIWGFFQSVNSNDHPFYAVPFLWIVNFFRPLGGPGRRDLMPVLVLVWFIYCACLGALLGFMFQWMFGMFQRLKRHDNVHQIKAPSNPHPENPDGF